MDQLKQTKVKHPADGSGCWKVKGPAGAVQYDLLGNHLTLQPAGGELDSMGKRWADEVQGVAIYGDDATVFELLAGHYRAMAGTCVRCANTTAVGTCCSAHGKNLCHLCYRRTHWVEVCVAGCGECAAEKLPVKLSDLAVTR